MAAARIAALLVGAAAAALATSVTGPIGFVSLISGPIAVRSVGADRSVALAALTAAGADANAGFPIALTSAWGKTEVKKQPLKVATVSGGDRDRAGPRHRPGHHPERENGAKVPEYKQHAIDKPGAGKLKT